LFDKSSASAAATSTTWACAAEKVPVKPTTNKARKKWEDLTWFMKILWYI
jgi:hypothetical protein